MLMLSVKSRLARTDHKSTVRNARVITFKLIKSNKMDCRVVVCKIVRHFLYLTLYSSLVRTLLGYNKALSRVLLTCRKCRLAARTDSLKCGFHRNGILLCIYNAIYTANGIGVSLAYALSPEGIVCSVGKHRRGIHSVEREHTRIPACRNKSELSCRLGGSIYIFKMLGYFGMGVKAVNYVEEPSHLRSLLGQVSRTSATKDKHVYFICHFLNIVCMYNGNIGSVELYRFRVSTCKNCRKLHIGVLSYRRLYAPSEISVTENTYSYHNLYSPLLYRNVSSLPTLIIIQRLFCIVKN